MHLRQLLLDVRDGRLSPDEAAKRLRAEPSEALLNGLNLDYHRELRTGLPEVVFAQGKSDARLSAALESLQAEHGAALASRVSPEQGGLLRERFPAGQFWPEAKLFALGRDLALAPPWTAAGEVIIVTAGAADLACGLEALGAARFFGLAAGLVPDCGVAGLHRITPYLDALFAARLHIVIAGMEGALPGVIAGLCGKPVIAVPTSVGYGTGLGGVAALMSMLNSCASGLAVMNIDNGFGAAAFAAKALRATPFSPDHNELCPASQHSSA